MIIVAVIVFADDRVAIVIIVINTLNAIVAVAIQVLLSIRGSKSFGEENVVLLFFFSLESNLNESTSHRTTEGSRNTPTVC